MDTVAPAGEERSGSAIIFNRNFNVVALINLFTMTAYYLLFVISTPYAIRFFHTSASMAGLVAGIMVIGCLAGRFVTGHLICVLGSKRVLLAGILLYLVSIALYFIAHTLTALIFVRLVSGVGIGCIGTATGTIVAYVIPRHRHGLGISYFSMSTALALALGPFLGISLLQILEYKDLFLLCLGFGACNVLAFLALSVADHGRASCRLSSLFVLDNYIDRKVIPFSLVVLAACLGWGNVQAFLSFYAGERGLTGAASLFFLVYAAVILLTRPLTGKIFDSRGENVIVYPALFLTAAGLLCLGMAASDWAMLLAGALLGAGFGNFQSSSQAISLRLVPKERFGQATSTFFIFFDLGMGLGPYLFGAFVPRLGYNGLYILLSGVAILSIGLYYRLHGRKQRAQL